MAAFNSADCTVSSTNESNRTVPTHVEHEENLAQLMTDENIDSLAGVKKFVNKHRGAVNLDQRNEHGQTALMLACYDRQKDIVKFLLQNGANPNLKCTEKGNTALHYVCQSAKYGYPESETDEDEDWRLVTSEDESEADSDNAALERRKCVSLPSPVYCCTESLSSVKANDKGIHVVKLTNNEKNEGAIKKLTENYGVTMFENDEGKLTFMYKREKRSITIINLLIGKYGATLQQNKDGLNPVDLAALNRKQSTVMHFVDNDYIPKVEKVRALEILGACLLLSDDFEDAYVVLANAMERQYEDPNNVLSQNFISEFADCLGQRECRTLRDLNRVEANKRAWKEQGFLIADRVIPDTLKLNYIYEPLVQYAYDILFSRRTLVKAFKVFNACLSLEHRGLLPVGHVLMFLNYSVCNASSSPSLHRVIPQYVDLLCCTVHAYVEVVEQVSCMHLTKSVGQLLKELSELLYSFTEYHSRRRGIDCILEPACKVVKTIWSKISKESVPVLAYWHRHTLSVSHNVLQDMVSHLGHNYDFERYRDICFSFKWLFACLVPVEGAFDVNFEGNTMLHSLMHFVHSGELQMVLDITRLLVRHGCPTRVKNKEGKTPFEIAEEESAKLKEHQLPQLEELYRLVSPFSVPSLQELTLRSILCCRIPYKDRLPVSLCKLLEDDFLDEDSDAYETENTSDDNH